MNSRKKLNSIMRGRVPDRRLLTPKSTCTDTLPGSLPQYRMAFHSLKRMHPAELSLVYVEASCWAAVKTCWLYKNWIGHLNSPTHKYLTQQGVCSCLFVYMFAAGTRLGPNGTRLEQNAQARL